MYDGQFPGIPPAAPTSLLESSRRIVCHPWLELGWLGVGWLGLLYESLNVVGQIDRSFGSRR